MQKPSLIILFLFCTAISFAGQKQEADRILPDVTARGRALYEYDQAAWHATDAVQATHPPEESMGRYIARKTDAGWTVVFGRLNEKRDKFLVAFEAVQGATSEQFKVIQHNPPQENASFYLASSKAIDLALANAELQRRPYNVAVLPALSNQLYLYVMPAQTKPGVYPLGGDVRFLISADGSTIVEKRQLHKTILEISEGSLPKGSKMQNGVHSHFLTDVPEDTDVFHVLTRQPSVPEFIITKDRKFYEITTDGTIYKRELLGK